jgi:amidohydrolase
VVNEETSVAILRDAAVAAAGLGAPDDTEQSLGGEDFAYYLDEVAGAMARLGVRSPEDTGPYLDLHQPSFDIDERALGVGVRLLAHAVFVALGRPFSADRFG